MSWLEENLGSGEVLLEIGRENGSLLNFTIQEFEKVSNDISLASLEISAHSVLLHSTIVDKNIKFGYILVRKTPGTLKVTYKIRKCYRNS